MLHRVHVLVVATVLLTSSAAMALPIRYTLAYDGSLSGTPGTGSFDWDDVTATMTGFIWDFGSGRTGGLTDANLGFNGPFLFNYILHNTGVDVQASLTVNGLSEFIGPFPSVSPVRFCFGLASPGCGAAASADASYEFTDDVAAPTLYRGYVTISPTTEAVPEPASVLLLGTGIAGLMVNRIRRRRR